MSNSKKKPRAVMNAWGRRCPDVEDRPNPIQATSKRRYGFSQDHMPPQGKHKRGRMLTHEGRWPGTAKEHEPIKRKKRNHLSWRKMLRTTRRNTLALKRARALVAAADTAKT